MIAVKPGYKVYIYKDLKMHEEQMKHTYVIIPIYRALFFASLSLLTRHYELYVFFLQKYSLIQQNY